MSWQLWQEGSSRRLALEHAISFHLVMSSKQVAREGQHDFPMHVVCNSYEEHSKAVRKFVLVVVSD